LTNKSVREKEPFAIFKGSRNCEDLFL